MNFEQRYATVALFVDTFVQKSCGICLSAAKDIVNYETTVLDMNHRIRGAYICKSHAYNI